MATKERILEKLKEVADQEIGMSIVDLGMVREILVEGGKAIITIALTTPHCPLAGVIQADVEKAARSVEGVESVEVRITSLTFEEMQKIFSDIP